MIILIIFVFYFNVKYIIIIMDIIYLFVLLVIYILHINKIIFFVLSLGIIGYMILQKNYKQAAFFILLVYILSIYNIQYEKFTNQKQLPSSSKKRRLLPSSSKKRRLLPKKKTQCNDEKRCNIKISSEENDKIKFVFESLLDQDYLEKYSENINNLLEENSYCIKNIYDLSDKVLNVDNDAMYNNFLEKITCRQDNNVNYLDCNNDNYKKLYAFCELILVYTFSIEFVIELINKYNIYGLCDLNNNRGLLSNNLNADKIQNSFSGFNTNYGYEYMGLEYYLEEKYINDKYYELLEIMDFDKILDKYDSVNSEKCSVFNNDCIKLREKLYRYKHCNKKVVKDLNSIVVLFIYYDVFDPIKINSDYYNNWEYHLFKSVNLNELYWKNNPYFIEYEVKDKIIKYINDFTSKNLNIKNLDKKQIPKCINNFKLYGKEEGKSIDEIQNLDENIEDKLCDNLKNVDVETTDKILDGKNIIENFPIIINNIITDIIVLFNKKNNCNDSKTALLYYISEIIKILISKGNMFYVGILIVIISLIFYFIDISN